MRIIWKDSNLVKELNKLNEPISSITHAIGIVLAASALTLLVTFAYLYGTTMHLIGFSIFGVALIFLYTVSSIYHFFPKKTAIKKIFQRIDHSMIFIFIAATYTPICLTIDNRIFGWTLFGIVWVFASVGIFIKATEVKIPEWISTSMYVVMGSLLLLGIKPLSAWLPYSGMWWLFGGGLFYLIGAVFFSLEDVLKKKYKFGMHEIFHLFVMAGTFSHFWLFLKYVLYI